MPVRGRKIRDRLAKQAGKTRITDMAQADIDLLWLERVCAVEKIEDELYELEKLAARNLRNRISSYMKVEGWGAVTHEMIQSFPRHGLSECELCVLGHLKRPSSVQKPKINQPLEAVTVTKSTRHKVVSERGASLSKERSQVDEIYHGSSSARSKALYRQLEVTGPYGQLAAELLRAQKSSASAKWYRGNYKDVAYDRKGSHLKKLCKLLAGMNFPWGWGEDSQQDYAPFVLYVELPEGQVSFHALERGEGPDYPCGWDGENLSEERIIQFAESILRHSGGCSYLSGRKPK